MEKPLVRRCQHNSTLGPRNSFVLRQQHMLWSHDHRQRLHIWRRIDLHRPPPQRLARYKPQCVYLAPDVRLRGGDPDWHVFSVCSEDNACTGYDVRMVLVRLDRPRTLFERVDVEIRMTLQPQRHKPRFQVPEGIEDEMGWRSVRAKGGDEKSVSRIERVGFDEYAVPVRNEAELQQWLVRIIEERILTYMFSLVLVKVEGMSVSNCL